MKFKYTDFSFIQREIETIENYLKKAHDQFVQSTVIFEARNYASKNLPNDTDDSLEPYITTIRGFYDKLKKEVSLRLQAGIQRALGAVNIATANENIAAKQKAIKQEQDDHDRLAIDRQRINVEGDHASYKKQRKLLLAFAIGECLWTMAAFLKLGDVVIIAICLGLVIGVAQISAVKTTTQIIKEVEDRQKRKIYTIIAAIAFFVLSICLAMLRYWFIHTGTAVGVPFIVMNPFTFVAINMLFIAASALIVYFYYPSKSEIKDMHKAEDLDKEIEKSNAECKRLNIELTALTKEREFLIELRSRRIHAEKMLHEKVNTLFDQAIGAFKHENTVKRSDGKFPQCFKNPHNPLPDDDSDQFLLLDK